MIILLIKSNNPWGRIFGTKNYYTFVPKRFSTVEFKHKKHIIQRSENFSTQYNRIFETEAYKEEKSVERENTAGSLRVLEVMM